MPTPLKECFNKAMVTTLATRVHKHHPDFDRSLFRKAVLDDQWAQRELKDRMNHLAACLNTFLPSDYRKALRILKPVADQFSGLEHLIFPAYVEQFGAADVDASIDAMAYFTERSSSELAIRPFIIAHQDRMMRQMAAWAASDNLHLRRLASEGCRPRLPWAMALPAFKRDPAPVLQILKMLMTDSSEYVRRSVANNLNDISKDHPDTTIAVTREWIGQQRDTDRLLKHACRTLLKQGHPEALALFGFPNPDHIQITQFNVAPSVAMGDALAFSFTLHARQGALGKCRIEYDLGFMRKNGKISKKVFQISESEPSGHKKIVEKKHSFRPISTRTYYPGRHRIAIRVNGHELKHGHFELSL